MILKIDSQVMTGLMKAIGASSAIETVPIPGGEKQLSAQGRPLLCCENLSFKWIAPITTKVNI